MGEARQHVLEMLDLGDGRVAFGQVPDRLRHPAPGQELHRHRGQLGGLRARMPLPDERPLVRGEGVEGMTRLVQQRGHVLQHPRGVHEDEGPPARVQRVAVAARRLALPRIEVEQALGDHGRELGAQLGIDPHEHPRRRGREVLPGVERTGHVGPVGTHREVPRAAAWRGRAACGAAPASAPPPGPPSRAPPRGTSRNPPPNSRSGTWPGRCSRGRTDIPAFAAMRWRRESISSNSVGQLGRAPTTYGSTERRKARSRTVAIGALQERRELGQRLPLALPLRRHAAGDLLVLRPPAPRAPR